MTAWKPLHHAWHDVQPFVDAELLTFGEQKLQPQTDAHERLAGGDRVSDWLNQLVAFQIRHAVAESPHARQDEMARIAQSPTITRDHGAVPDRLERLVDAPKIPHAIVNDRDHK